MIKTKNHTLIVFIGMFKHQLPVKEVENNFNSKTTYRKGDFQRSLNKVRKKNNTKHK